MPDQQFVVKFTGPTPERATEGSSGYDLKYNGQPFRHYPSMGGGIDSGPIYLTPGGRVIVPTGVRLEMPRGVEAQIRPRSGLAAKHGITVLNSPGTIDSDYRDELMVILVNHGSETYTIREGDRVAQLVFNRVEHPMLIGTDELEPSDTGRTGGLGHTGR